MQLFQQMYSAGCISSKGTVRCSGLVIALVRRRFHSRSARIANVGVEKIIRAKKSFLFQWKQCVLRVFVLLIFCCRVSVQETLFSVLNVKKSNVRSALVGVRSPTLQIYFLVLRKLFFIESC
jgi:hypothetical protein